jgi:O-antigen biosynthesis protein
MTKISLITAYYKNEDMTRDFLANLAGKLPDDTEVILVNAGSEPIDSLIVTKRIDLPVNYSFSNSFNAGLKEATGEFICIINNDAFPETNDWLQELIKLTEKHNAWMVAPTNDKTVLGNCHLTGDYDEYYTTPFFPAVCWVMTRNCLDTVGLFDEQFEIGEYEDNDYCERLKRAGGTLLISKKVQIRHLESQTIRLFNVTEISHENHTKFTRKWMS